RRGLPTRETVPDGNSMSPPELPRDVPVADVLHPVDVNALPALGKDADFTRANGFECRPGERLHAHEPLIRQARFHHSVATIAVSHGMLVRLHLYQRAGLAEHLNHALSRFEPVQPAQRFR